MVEVLFWIFAVAVHLGLLYAAVLLAVWLFKCVLVGIALIGHAWRGELG